VNRQDEIRTIPCKIKSENAPVLRAAFLAKRFKHTVYRPIQIAIACDYLAHPEPPRSVTKANVNCESGKREAI